MKKSRYLFFVSSCIMTAIFMTFTIYGKTLESQYIDVATPVQLDSASDYAQSAYTVENGIASQLESIIYFNGNNALNTMDVGMQHEEYALSDQSIDFSLSAEELNLLDQGIAVVNSEN